MRTIVRLLIVSSLLTPCASFASLSELTVPGVNYAAFAGEYSYVSGSGKYADDCKGLVRVEADPVKNEITNFRMQHSSINNGFVTGFFSINQGPQNDCCTGSDLFYHHDMLTTGLGTSVEYSVNDYYKFIRKDEVDLFKGSLSLSGNILTLRETLDDYKSPENSFSRTCEFEKK